MTRIVFAVALFVVCLSLSSAVSQERMGDKAGLEKTVNTYKDRIAPAESHSPR
jgi:hypothetical protein